MSGFKSNLLLFVFYSFLFLSLLIFPDFFSINHIKSFISYPLLTPNLYFSFLVVALGQRVCILKWSILGQYWNCLLFKYDNTNCFLLHKCNNHTTVYFHSSVPCLLSNYFFKTNYKYFTFSQLFTVLSILSFLQM